MGACKVLVSRLQSLVVARCHLVLENLALRQQLAVLERSGKRPKATSTRPHVLDPAFVTLARLAFGWAAIVVRDAIAARMQRGQEQGGASRPIQRAGMPMAEIRPGQIL